MKKFVLITLLVIVAAAGSVFTWWQFHKKKIIKDAIQSAVQKNTDSLYTLRYDSSSIDEINGKVSFFNVSLQSDDAQKELLAATDSLPGFLFFIKVKEVRATGVDMAGMVQNRNVRAKIILLDRPEVHIFRTGMDKDASAPIDTMALYNRIIGKFKAINADIIQVSNGQVIVSDKKGQSQATLENININLQNFLVDSLHNYNNVISYFINNVLVTIENIQLPETAGHTRINISRLRYDAALRTLTIKQLQQYRTGQSKPVIELNNTSVTKLNTDAFILSQQLKAGMVSCDGGWITIYKKEKGKQQGNKQIEFSTDFDAIQVEGMKLGSTRVIIIDETKPTKDSLVLNDVRFNMARSFKVSQGNTLNDVIVDAEWKLTSSGFSFISKDKMYRLEASGLELDNVSSAIGVRRFSLTPLFSESAFSRQLGHQADRYDLSINDIKLNAVNFKRLVADNALEADNGSLQISLKVFNDRTLPEDTASKIGKAPYQMLVKMKLPVYIKRMEVKNSLVEYKERGAASEKNGVVAFKNISGTISNITNIPERIALDPTLKVNARADLLGTTNLSSTWELPLTAGNGNFTVSANLSPLDAISLNPLIEPLAMASIKSGQLRKTTFVMNGNEYKATINMFLAYNDFKIGLLKKGTSGQFKNKDLGSFVANALVKNSSPSGGKTPKRVETTNERMLNRSFFNLWWKTIFKGLKKAVSKI